MPSERRRQRQQRVRHEAGDDESTSYFSSVAPTEEKKASPDNAESPQRSISEENEDHQTNGSFNKVGKQRSKPDNNTNQSQGRGVHQHPDSSDGKRDNRRSDNSRGYDDRRDRNRGRGNYQQRGNWRDARGRGHSHSQAPVATPVINSNVSYAEPPQYEPVTIMPSSSSSSSTLSKTVPESSKYRRREVISNWSQYEQVSSDEEVVDGEDYLRGEDFSEVLKNSAMSGSGGYLHLKGEMTWGDVDASYLGTHGLGALKVTDLVSSLQTIPLHTLLDIPAKKLPVHTISYYTHLADDNAKLFKPNAEYVTDIEVNEKIIESLKITSESLDLMQNESAEPEVKSPVDATLKFSSAFAPEPDDVDLDDLMRERTPDSVSEEVLPKPIQEEKKENPKKKKKNKQQPSVQDIPATQDVAEPKLVTTDLLENRRSSSRPSSEEKENQASFNFSLPKTDVVPVQPKEFNFGLAKIQPSKTKELKKLAEEDAKSESSNKAEASESSSTTEPMIDLDKPVIDSEKKPVLLVTKTEAENLEDWLDSVLDD